MVYMSASFFWVVSFFFLKQKTAYEMRISDWSSDVCSSDLSATPGKSPRHERVARGAFMPSPPVSPAPHLPLDRKSVVSGKSVSVRVDLGGRRIIKEKKMNKE